MNLLFCINNNYVYHITFLIRSLHKYNKCNLKCFFIYSDIQPEKKEIIIKLLRKLNQPTPQFIKYPDCFIDKLPIKGLNWSKEIYYRLFAPYLINEDKILYLDADVICTGAIQDFYNTDTIISAVANDTQDACKRLSLPHGQQYFNSGVLLMNLKKLRELYSIDEIKIELEKLVNILNFPDQDFINIKMGHLISPATIQYNYMINVAEINKDYPKETNPKLIHYVMEKPWNIKFPYKTDIAYFKVMWLSHSYIKPIYLFTMHRLYRIYQQLFVPAKYRRI